MCVIHSLTHTLRRFPLKGDVKAILALLDEENKTNPQDYSNPFAPFRHALDTPDHCGNTPLLLAVKLGHVELAKLLIAEGFQCDVMSSFHLVHRDNATEGSISQDQSLLAVCAGPAFHLLDEAVLLRNIPLIKCAYKQMQRKTYSLWLEKKELVLKTLLNIPDFYVELNWEFLGSGITTALLDVLFCVFPAGSSAVFVQRAVMRNCDASSD